MAGVSVVVLILLVVGLVVSRDRTPEPTAADTTPAPTAATADPTDPTDPTATPTATSEPTTPTTTAGPADPRQQAEVIDAVLDRSGSSRTKLNSAIERIGGCRDLTGALADMREVGEERRTQMNEVGAADLSALSNGESLRSTLVTALRHSLDADAAFVQWAEPTVSEGCANTAARRSAYSRGQAASTRAGSAKEAFLAQWNPVATGLGLPARTRQGI